MKQIGFKNFRRFENFPMLNLGDVTILVGRNNAGKSTMVKALLLLLDNLKERVPHGEKHLFHFDLSQEHNTHVNTFKRALCSKSNDSNISFEATFASSSKKSYNVDSDEEVNFTISLTVEGDRTRDRSTGEITFIRISDNIKNNVFEFDLGVKRMRLIFGDTANAKSQSHEEVLPIEELKAKLAEANQRGDIEDIARLTADIQKLENVRKKKPTKSDSGTVETDLEIKTFEPWAGVANYIYAFVDYYSKLEYKKTKKRGLTKEAHNYSMLNGAIVGIEQFAVSVATTLVETRIEYIYAHAASQKVLFSIDDKNDYLAKTLHEFYKAHVESGDTAHRFLKYWLGEFGIGEDINVETIEGEGYTAEIMCQDGVGHHLADLGTGSVQLVILLLKLATLVKKYGGMHLDLSEEERQLFGYYGPTDVDYEGSKPLVVIEEPEQNLHPAIQSKLAELFYEVSSNYGIRFIIETHSEYLIRRSQVVVAENSDKESWSNPFAVYYFQDNDQPYPMEYRKDGKFSNEFGTGFFDEASNLAFEIF